MSVAGVAIAVLLVLVVLALYRGFSRMGQTLEGFPGELWLAQAGTTDPFQSLSILTQNDLEAARNVAGVQAVVPVLVRQMSFEADGREASARLMGIGIPETVPVEDDFRRRYLPVRGSMIVDEILARQEGLSEGDSVVSGASTLTIGEVQPPSAEAFEPFAFVSYEDARHIFGFGEIINFGMVFLVSGSDTEETAGAIERAVPGSRVFTRQQFAGSLRKEIDETFLPIIGILLAIGFTVGAAVVGLTIYTATIERSREFGVMKAVGASGAFLYRIVASQSAMLTSAGFALGLVGALAVADVARSAVPDFATDFRAADILAVLIGTGVMAFAASLVPVRRLDRIDPAIVFRA
jgi:putative ABC transport system permease protein